MSEKNPYKDTTPEWQLWENMKSSRSLSLSYANDAARYAKLSQEAREKADLYEAALEKLKPISR